MIFKGVRALQNKIIIFVFLAALLLSVSSFSAYAYELDTSAGSIEGYYLYNFENDLVMLESGTDKRTAPGPTVKMMTGLLAIESGIDMQSTVTVTSSMLGSSSGRNMKLEAGDRITIEDLVYATLCGGYNDAATVLALAISPTLSEFLSKMNAKAAELGMSSTTYLNVTGTAESGMETTVGDIAILAKYLSKNPTFIEICATKSHRLSDSSTCSAQSVTNRSSLLASNKGMSSFTTGSVDKDSVVLYYKSGELSFIAIVMNAKLYESTSGNDAEYFAKKLFGHAFNGYSYQTVLTENNLIASVPVKYSVSKKEIKVYLSEDLKLFLPTDLNPQSNEHIFYSCYIYDDELKAPVKANDEVGMLTVFYDGTILKSIPIVAGESADRNGFLFLMELMRTYIGSRAFLITVLSLVVMLALFYLSKTRMLNKMYKKRTPTRIHRK